MKRSRLLFSIFLILILVSVLSSITAFAEGTDSWTLKAAMNNARRLHQVAVVNDKVYAIGGYAGGVGARNSLEEYDPTTNTWTTKASMTNARYNFNVAVVDGKIYALGGLGTDNQKMSSVEEYDPATDTWTIKASMPIIKGYFQVAVVNSKIYTIGGINNSGTAINSVEEYDPTTNVWTTKAPMSVARQYHRIAVMNGNVYVVGGYGADNSYLNSVELYNSSTNTWTTKPPMTDKRMNHELAVVNGKIYAIGGDGSVSGAAMTINSVEEYDPETNTWTTKASINNKREFFEVAVINNKIYTLSGRDVITSSNIVYLNSVEEYDPATNTWTIKAPMTTTRTASVPSQLDIGVVGGNIYAVGGCDASITALGSVEMYTLGTTPSEPEPEPEVTGNSGILEITMTNGNVKEYDLTATELQSFLTWYDGRTNDEGKEYYIFNKKNNIKPFLSRKEYISYDKISSFEVKEYTE